MDDRRFDALTRTFATAGNRRQVLKGLLGLGGLFGGAVARDARAARRPAPTPRPISCPGNQVPVDGVCTCPTGAKCRAECCPENAECCDGACCYGACYGEELCCPTGKVVCDGQCRDWECCTNDQCAGNATFDPESHTCVCVPNCDGKACGDNGCDGSCGACPEGQTCTEGACTCPSGHLCSDNTCHECCTDTQCPANHVCDPQTRTCVCAPNCDGKSCGDNGCGGSCGTCPEGRVCRNGACGCANGVLCGDQCQECCEAADCVSSYGWDLECSRCLAGTCGYYSGFCTGGVCGVSSTEVIGHCIECGKRNGDTGDSCSAAVPCCAGYHCDDRYGDQGICQPNV